MTPSSYRDQPVLIIGGGIGGLTTALALAQRGWQVRVLERAEEFGEIGAGIQLGPNAFKVFERLGLTAKVSECATFPEHLVAMDGVSGECIATIPTGREISRRFGYPYGLIHRADLQTVLLAECARLKEISLHVDTKVSRVSQLNNSVAIEVENGKSMNGVAAIGADGLWSCVRKYVVGDETPRVSGHIAYRAVLPIEEVPVANRRNDMVLWAGPKYHLVHYPLRSGKLFNLVAVFHSTRYQEGWDEYGDPEELQARFSGARPEVLGMLQKIDSWRMWVLCDRDPISDWSKGRITLVGDAAHPMLQYMAQGACMAMEDAVVLANCLEAADTFESAFVAYQKARYLRTARVQLTARLYGEVYHASGAARDLRNAVLKARTQEQALESMAWLYDTAELGV